jgi:cellulose synthase/poly-beta-1,6-N-acetylglucosamine synthase-like glycosyltransferase
MIIKSEFWFKVLRFLFSMLPFIGALVVGIIAGLIWNGLVGFFTFFGIGVAFTLYLMGRQLWWWITKTGDYETKDKEEQ